MTTRTRVKPHNRLTNEQLTEVRRQLRLGVPNVRIAEKIGCDPVTVSQIKHGRHYASEVTVTKGFCKPQDGVQLSTLAPTEET